jgi:hypothetical protein
LAGHWEIPSGAQTTADQLNRGAEQFPNSALLQRQRLRLALQSSDPGMASSAIARLAELGAALAPEDRNQAARLIGADRMASFSRLLDSNARPIRASRAAFAIGPENRLVHSLIWDGDRRQFYAMSVIDRRVLAVGRQGSRIVLDRDLASPLIGAYDSRSRRVWIVVARLSVTPPSGSFEGLLWFDRQGREQRFNGPPGSSFGDLTGAADGSIYVAGGEQGAVYVCRPNCTSVETVANPHTFRIAGAVAAPGSRWLYVSDVKYGLAAIERTTGRIFQVRAAGDMMLDGIDSMLPYGRDLIAIQGTANPQRIIRLSLSGDGLRISHLRVVEQNLPEWGGLSPGTIVGNRLFYIGNAQWESYELAGRLTAGAQQRPTLVRSVELQ